MNTNAAAEAVTENLADKLSDIWAHAALQNAIPGLLMAFGVYALLLTLLRLGGSIPVLRRISLPVNLFGFTCAIRLFLGDVFARIHPELIRVFTAVLVFLAIFLAMRLTEILIFDFLFIRQNRKPVPVVLRDIVRFGLTALLLAFVLKGFFPGINFNVLAVSSIIVGYVLGNATQDTLGNLVAGLALNSEDSFSIGDWITIGSLTGQITEITWRATRLRTKDSEDIIVPNSTLSKETLINHSRPTPQLRTRLRIGVSYEAPPNLVRQVLLDAIRDVPGIDEKPGPKIRLIDYADFAVVYEVLFYVHDFVKLDDIRADFMNLVWYRFKRAGISIPFPVRDVRARQFTREDDLAEERRRVDGIARLFEGVDLMACLSEAERHILAAGCRSRVFAAKEDVVRQGEPGQSLFLIESGRVGVFIGKPDGGRVSVGELGPGQFFGERSLLTGEGRSATVTALQDAVVVELGKEVFARVLQAKPEIAEQLGRLLAERDRAREEISAAADKARDSEAVRQKGRQFMERILAFFGVSRSQSNSG